MGNKHYGADNLALTLTYTCHMCRRCYTSDFNGVVTATEACYPGEKKSVSSDCTREVIARFTSVFAANSFSSQALISIPVRKKSLSAISGP